MTARTFLPLAAFACLLFLVAPTAWADCYQNCEFEFDMCDLNCDPYGGPNGCQACYDRYDECRDFCQECPIVGTRVDDPVLVSSTPLSGSICLFDNVEHWQAPYPKNLFRPWDLRYKQTTTRVTQNCDGSITYQVINTQFYNQTCWQDTDIPCSTAFLNASTRCTF
ncbi:MAG: hypothetical protein AAGC60_22980 [Acidobacteriota bacterium]